MLLVRQGSLVVPCCASRSVFFAPTALCVTHGMPMRQQKGRYNYCGGPAVVMNDSLVLGGRGGFQRQCSDFGKVINFVIADDIRGHPVQHITQRAQQHAVR